METPPMSPTDTKTNLNLSSFHFSPPPTPGSQKRIPVSSARRKSVPELPHHERQRSYHLNDIDEHSTQQTVYQSSGYATPTQGTARQYQQQQLYFNDCMASLQSTDSRDLKLPLPGLSLNLSAEYNAPLEPLESPSFKPQNITQQFPILEAQSAIISSGESNRSSKSSSNSDDDGQRRIDSPISAASSGEGITPAKKSATPSPKLQYHHQQPINGGSSQTPNSVVMDINGPPYSRNTPSPSSDGQERVQSSKRLLSVNSVYRGNSRPVSSISLSPDAARGRSPSTPNIRAASGHSWESRRASYVDLTQPAHVQPPRPVSSFDNSHLKTQVGSFASLLSNKQTLEMYRRNAKKSQDPVLQYELAVFMVQLANQQLDIVSSKTSPVRKKSSSSGNLDSPIDSQNASTDRKELLREARQILEKLCNRLPQAQYYLADAYSSGLFNKGKEELEKAFPLFVAAAKHGHAEAGYRAGLCFEFGWGCRNDPNKSVQFYRQAASRSHPGAMTRLGMACVKSDLGLQGRYREGIKWLKRATEIADEQYPNAPYELALMHETGFGDDVFQDPSYSAQLFTQAADLGHVEAYFRMGDAYEHGKLNCPRDPALSVHFYTGAAQHGHPDAMMALCAWYLVGAEPVLAKNEAEAYAWAVKASEHGLPKAQYAVGYFTEMGIGCRQDPLEANARYVKAADAGDERAIARLKIINEAASGAKKTTSRKLAKKSAVKEAKTPDKKLPLEGGGDKGDCTIM